MLEQSSGTTNNGVQLDRLCVLRYDIVRLVASNHVGLSGDKTSAIRGGGDNIIMQTRQGNRSA